ncbi:uncharacterized protein LOC126273008 [Schistocerca gregaria]|uniref:uncharacterized protein LOC126273008 n=1 Tax=Schistocerca gregaria TaxID=7010 RepID=UPI00211F3B60|nr:uncharacterized protein LOC126273008 [Schistocerca gregaria]
MSTDTERVIMVALGLVAHCSLVFVPIIGEFHPTVGSVAFAYAALVITSKYDICPASWRIEHPNISRLIEFLVHVGVLNFAITTIWLPLVMFLTARADIIAILACTVDSVLRLGGAAISWAESSEAPRQVAALLALGAAACAVYVTDFCSTVRNVLARCCLKGRRRVRIVDCQQKNELELSLKSMRRTCIRK